MPRDIVVIGASSGGTHALRVIAGGLPGDFHASIFVVVHTAPDSPGVLDGIINKAGPLPAWEARDCERIKRGHVYIAPPDYHLMIEPGIMRLTRGPSENCFRPAIDPLFRSAAQVYGPRVIGVILTGGLDDGTAGLWTVKQLGGTTIVQDPEEAMAESMPRSALTVRVDYCVPVAEMAGLLTELVHSQPPSTKYEPPEGVEIEA